MAFCIKCGAQVNDGINFCPQCGGEIPKQQYQEQKQAEHQYVNNDTEYQQYGQQDQYQQAEYQQAGYQQYDQQNYEQYFPIEDVRQNKVMAVLSYLGILVLIPIFAGDKKSQYTAFHVNQGLVLFIASLVIDALTGSGVFGWFSWLIFDNGLLRFVSWILDLGVLVLLIMGIVYACKGVCKELPIIGKIKLIHW